MIKSFSLDEWKQWLQISMGGDLDKDTVSDSDVVPEVIITDDNGISL